MTRSTRRNNMPKPKMYRCGDCDATFMKPLMQRGKMTCPLCFSLNIGDLKSLLLKTDEEREDAVLYKDDKTGKEQWIKRDPDERVKEQIRGDEPPKEQIEQERKVRQKQKSQSDYHRARYKLKQLGKWTGSMKESLESLTDEEHAKFFDK